MADLSHLRRTQSRPPLGSKPFVGPAEQGSTGGGIVPTTQPVRSAGVRPFAPGAQSPPAAPAPATARSTAVAQTPPFLRVADPAPAPIGSPAEPEPTSNEHEAEAWQAPIVPPNDARSVESAFRQPGELPSEPSALAPEGGPDEASAPVVEPAPPEVQGKLPGQHSGSGLEDVRSELDEELSRFQLQSWERMPSESGFPELEPLPAADAPEALSPVDAGSKPSRWADEPSGPPARPDTLPQPAWRTSDAGQGRSGEMASARAPEPAAGGLPAGKPTDPRDRVAAILESVAERVRLGEFPLHGASDRNDAAALAAVLSALLGASE